MRATDQITAMEMMAVDPMRYVVAPRFLGGVVAMPLLAAMFNIVGLFGRSSWACSCWGSIPAPSGRRCRAPSS